MRRALLVAALGLVLACNYAQEFEAPAPPAGGAPPAADSPIAQDPPVAPGKTAAIVLASGQGDSSWPGIASGAGSPQTGPDRIAVDATHVYWLNLRGEVMRVPTSGGTVERVATTSATPVWIVLDEDFVYFSTQDGNVSRVAKSGGEPRLVASPVARKALHVRRDIAEQYPTELFIAGGEIHWSDGSGIYACPVTGCTGAPRSVFASENAELRPYSFAVDANGGRYAGIELHRAQSPSSVVISYSLNVFREGRWLGLGQSMAFYELRGGANEVYGLVTSDYGLTGVARVTESSVTFLASGDEVPGTPRGLALDDAHVYWANPAPPRIEMHERIASVVRCKKAGCASPEVLAADQIVPRAVAVGRDAVYWTTGDGNVMKVLKPEGATALQ